MSAMILLSPQGKALAYLGIDPERRDAVSVAHNYQFVDMKVGDVEGAVYGKIKANSRVVMHLAAPIKVMKYNCFVQINPVLFSYGIAQCPTVLHTGATTFDVMFDARKQLEIEDLEYLVRFYFID